LFSGLKSHFNSWIHQVQTTAEKVKNEFKRISKEIEQQIDHDMDYDPLHVYKEEEDEEKIQDNIDHLPWNTFEEGKDVVRDAILNLSKDRQNLLITPSEISDFVFHMNSYVSMAKIME
jgi:hypothetical protein